MPLMGSFYVGTSGLQTSQNALNTTAHNLSNIDTIGYTRQQVLQANKRYNTVGTAYVSEQQSGLGVSYAKVRQVRDSFLDKSYRREAGRASFYDTSYSTVTETETLFGEMEGVEFQTSLSDLWTSIQELAKDPSNPTNQGLLVSSAASFLERAQSVYSGLSSYQDNLNQQISDQVDSINEYGQKIYELNQQIVRAEASGSEEANDLRDSRNQLLDELSAMVPMSYEEDVDGAVSVSIEGVDFVTKTYINKMGITTDSETGFHTPVWPANEDSEVFDLTREISSDYNTDIGGLKAMLLLRGEKNGTYQDIPQKPVATDYATDAEYQAALQQYSEDTTTYNQTTAKSFLQNTMAEFDQLINGIVTGMNEILNPRTTDTTTGTTTVKGYDLFLRKNIDDVTTEEDDTQSSTIYTISNLKINTILLQQSSLLGCTQDENGNYTSGFMTADGQENKEMADQLTSLFSDDFASLNPNINTKANFIDYYNNLTGQVANVGSAYKGYSESQSTTVEAIEASRQQIVGVSDSEELTNMIKFQNAYNASSRYINAVNEMLGHLIEKLG